MWQVSCRRQGMLTQGSTLDPKCKLIISSFPTFPHLLDCLICTRNGMSIVLLLQMIGRWNRWWGGGGIYYKSVSVGTRGGYHPIFFFSCLFVFSSLTFSVLILRWLEHDGCYIYLFVNFFIFFVSGPFNLRTYWYTEIAVSLPCLLFCGFPWKKESV